MIHLFFIFRETIEIVLIIMKTYTTIQENQSKDLRDQPLPVLVPGEKKKKKTQVSNDLKNLKNEI